MHRPGNNNLQYRYQKLRDQYQSTQQISQNLSQQLNSQSSYASCEKRISTNEQFSQFKPAQQDEQKFYLTDSSHASRYFRYFPKKHDSNCLSTMVSLQKYIEFSSCYQYMYVQMRQKCIVRTMKEIQAIGLKPTPPGVFQKMFIKCWQKMMKEKRKTLKMADEQYYNYYYHPGELAYQIVKFDSLRALLKTPLNRVKQKVWKNRFDSDLPERYRTVSQNQTHKNGLCNEKQTKYGTQQNGNSIKQWSQRKQKSKKKEKSQKKVNSNPAQPLTFRPRRSVHKPNYDQIQIKVPKTHSQKRRTSI